MRVRSKVTWTVGMALLAGGVASCGIALRRDLSQVKPQEVIYDDMCGLQDYYDTLALRQAKAPEVVRSTDVAKETADRPGGGRAAFAFADDFQLKTLRRVLNENWSNVPPEVMKADRVELEVLWSEKAGTRRVVTTQEAEIMVGKQVWPLPYHVCLSELLFGERIYQTRRDVVGLPPLQIPVDAAPVNPVEMALAALRTGADAGAPPSPTTATPAAPTDGGSAPAP